MRPAFCLRLYIYRMYIAHICSICLLPPLLLRRWRPSGRTATLLLQFVLLLRRARSLLPLPHLRGLRGPPPPLVLDDCPTSCSYSPLPLLARWRRRRRLLLLLLLVSVSLLLRLALVPTSQQQHATPPSCLLPACVLSFRVYLDPVNQRFWIEHTRRCTGVASLSALPACLLAAARPLPLILCTWWGLYCLVQPRVGNYEPLCRSFRQTTWLV
jgi:hypothetical protein